MGHDIVYLEIHLMLLLEIYKFMLKKLFITFKKLTIFYAFMDILRT